MPAKKVIEKEEILNAAVEIVRESGIEALNMRTLAKRCNCSTQPIYHSFSGIDDLREQVAVRAVEEFDKTIKNEAKKGIYPEYKAIGMGYIRFAKEEKELFKFLFLSNHKNANKLLPTFYSAASSAKRSAGVNQNVAERIQTEMWLFVHGIASTYAFDFTPLDWELVSSMLTDVYTGLIAKLKGENK